MKRCRRSAPALAAVLAGATGLLALARRLGVIVTAHCENAEIVSQLQRRLLSEGKTGPEWHEPSRPPSVEAEGVQVPNASFNTGEVKVCQFMGDSPITQANEHGFV